MLIEFDDGSPFANGGAAYNTLPDYEHSDYVVVMVELGEQEESVGLWEAVVHTAIPYLICPPDIAAAVGINAGAPDQLGGVVIEGRLVPGRIYKGAKLALLADEDKGASVRLPVWAFVPDNGDDLTRDDLPKIYLGMANCLDRFQFAVDPYEGVFYFGAEVTV
jgi:hypothetical protein